MLHSNFWFTGLPVGISRLKRFFWPATALWVSGKDSGWENEIPTLHAGIPTTAFFGNVTVYLRNIWKFEVKYKKRLWTSLQLHFLPTSVMQCTLKKWEIPILCPCIATCNFVCTHSAVPLSVGGGSMWHRSTEHLCFQIQSIWIFWKIIGFSSTKILDLPLRRPACIRIFLDLHLQGDPHSDIIDLHLYHTHVHFDDVIKKNANMMFAKKYLMAHCYPPSTDPSCGLLRCKCHTQAGRVLEWSKQIHQW